MRLHGRGGQGTVMGAQMLAQALVVEGKYASSIPSFGVERRGAPVAAFLRFDDKVIRDTHQVYEPDCVVILDPSIAKAALPLQGLKGDGIVVVNTPKELDQHYTSYEQVKLVGMVDATGIALEKIGKAIGNTCMLGAISRVTGWVNLDSVIASLGYFFGGTMLAKNIEAAKAGYQKVNLVSLNRGST